MAKLRKKQVTPIIRQVIEERKNDTVCIQATEGIIQAVDELKRLEELKKKLQDLEEHYTDKVKNFMQFHQQLKDGAFTLATWKSHNRTSFDSTSFKTHFPDLYNSYLKENNIRVFRLS